MSETLTRYLRDLRDVENELHRADLHPAINAYSASLMALREANISDGATVDLIFALEDLQRVVKPAIEQLRAALLTDMQESGTTDIERSGVVVSIRGGALSGTPTDLKLLREAAPELFTPQPAKLERALLTKRLKAGIDVPGATLTTGEPSLSFRRK